MKLKPKYSVKMFEINPNAIYSLDELREKLDGIVSLPTLLKRLQLRESRVFKGAVFGWEIIEASHGAAKFCESADFLPNKGCVSNRNGKSSGLRKMRISDLARLEVIIRITNKLWQRKK